MMEKPELLAPAGDMEKLEAALDYGADAVYLGGDRFGLRAMAGNFDLDGLSRARELCLKRNRRMYLTLNASLRGDEFDDLAAYLEELRSLDIDAYIVSDPGVLSLIRELDPHRSIHLSTQANTCNPLAVNFWRSAGASRVNLARELTLEDIRGIGASTDCELEVFVHGAMCVSYSGRCLLSAAINRRSANRGSCTQPCRWRYALQEETRPGEYFALEEDDRGTYIMNSRDLCLIEYLPELLRAGVCSLKIEGRMKSRYYVAAVTRIYRHALDLYMESPSAYRYDPQWRQELEKVSHRPYDRGFLFGGGDALIHDKDAHYHRSADFVGVVLEAGEGGSALVGGRNRFCPGETLELIGPGMRQAVFTVGALFNAEGEPLSAAHPNLKVRMVLPPEARAGDLLRREFVEGP